MLYLYGASLLRITDKGFVSATEFIFFTSKHKLKMKKEKTVQPTSKSGGSIKPVLAAVGRPMDAQTEKAVCKLESDNYNTKKYWILHAINHVTICKQSSGSPAEESMSIPKKDFDKLIEWYTKEQFTNGG